MGNVDLASVEGPALAAARNRHLPVSAALGWLRAGWRDLMLEPGSSLAYGFAVFVVSVAIVAGLFFLGLDYILFPAIAAFMVVGPLVAVGLYEKSRLIEAGKPVSLARMIFVRPASGAQVLFIGVIMLGLALLWMRAAVILYALFFGLRPFPGPRPSRSNAVHDRHRMGDARHGHRRRRRVRGVLFRDQRLLRPDAARRADRRLHGDGHEHLPRLEQSAGHDRLGRDRAFADRSRPGDGNGRLDRRVPTARARDLARLQGDKVDAAAVQVMSCCAPGVEAALLISGSDPASSRLNEMLLASRDLGDGLRQTDLSVPGVHCASCIAAVEKALMALPGVEFARVNLSMKRVSVKWRAVDEAPPDLIGSLAGRRLRRLTFSRWSRTSAIRSIRRLVRALAVAGFCAMNIMLLSVSVWSGADGGTRQAFHWISAALALPAVLYSGRIFFASALSALRLGRTNMDVPISIGVIMAFGLSLYDTLHDGPHAYFDAATSLLFFLLIGRTLDHVMREKARSAVAGLARLAPRGATVVDPDGQRRYAPLAEIGLGASPYWLPPATGFPSTE